MNTLDTLNASKDALALAMKSTYKIVNKEKVQDSDYPLIAKRTREMADALEAHLAVDPQYEWGAGKLLVSCFGLVNQLDPYSPNVPHVGSGHPYFPVVEWTWHENDAKEMLGWLRDRVAWLES